MPEIKPIRLALHNADALHNDDIPLADRFKPIASRLGKAYIARHADRPMRPGEVPALIHAIADFAEVADLLDREHGADATLPHADAGAAGNEALRCLAELETWLARLGQENERPALYAIMIGAGLWLMRHDLAIDAPEPLVNALAFRANEATTRQDTAAAYALMQGLIAHLAPQLQNDLERSNPERPWRLLNLNFAITAIRTGDTSLMRFAFDTLNAHLPDERRGFYAEAYALAMQPGFPAETRAVIEAELGAASPMH
jgi:hypothetical protein